MSRPPDEDGPPTDPRERTTLAPDEYQATEEITKVETPVPQHQPTRPVTLADIFDAIGQLSEKVGAMGGRVDSIDAGLGGAWTELQAQRGDQQRGLERVAEELSAIRSDMATGIEGLHGLIRAHGEALGRIADDVGFIKQQTDGALAAISGLAPRLTSFEERQEKTQRVANGTWAQVTTGRVDEREREAIDAIVVSDSAAR